MRRRLWPFASTEHAARLGGGGWRAQKVFQKLSEAVRKASTLEATATVAELVALYHALVTFVLRVDTDVLPRLDAVLKLVRCSDA
jgi:hypothetical protein